MTEVLQLGPLALATDRLIAAAAIGAFLASTRLWRGLERTTAQNAAVLAVAAGALAARVAYVVEHLDSFAPEPWSALYVWQGGFDAVAGIVAAAFLLPLLAGARRAVVPLACLVVAAVAGLGGNALLDRRAVAPMPSGLTVVAASGQPVSLDALRGQPYVLNLWATWCPPCRRELPMLVAVAAERTDVPVLLVNQGEDAATVHAYLAAAGLPAGAVMLDPTSAAGTALRAPALPTTLFVGADGTVQQRHFGEISRAALTDGLRRLANGR